MSIFLLLGVQLELRSATLLIRCLFGALADDTKTGTGSGELERLGFVPILSFFCLIPRLVLRSFYSRQFYLAKVK